MSFEKIGGHFNVIILGQEMIMQTNFHLLNNYFKSLKGYKFIHFIIIIFNRNLIYSFSKTLKLQGI